MQKRNYGKRYYIQVNLISYLISFLNIYSNLKACIRSNEDREIIREGYKKIVQLLIEYNANINAQNNF